jgi:hypothetical protein
MKRVHSLSGLVGLAALALAATGCDSGPKLHDVSGRVTLDGAPLPEGDITLLPDGTAAAPQGARSPPGPTP